MPINTPKIKLSIIISLIINSSFGHAKSPDEIKETDPINFLFTRYEAQNLNEYPNSKHHHGSLNNREKPNILTSKHSTIVITSNNNNHTISYNSGVSFSALAVKDFNKVNFISLSDNGRYAVALGVHSDSKAKNNVFFIYDTITKKAYKFDHNDDITYDRDDYFFTTQDGRFSLYSAYDPETYPALRVKHGGYTPYNRMAYTLYDHKTKKTILLGNIENSELNNHKEKERFNAFKKLDFINDIIDKKPTIVSSSFDGKYLYGTYYRDKDLQNTILAFIYDNENEKLISINNSLYGSSKINKISKNNIFVGWYDSWDNNKKILNRQAFFYHPSDTRITDIKPLYQPSASFEFKTNSEATDISDDGNIIVGWSENQAKRNKYIDNKYSNSYYLRQAFIYYRDQDQISALDNMQDGDESEALSISADGQVIFGSANDKKNNWKLVAWKLNSDDNLNQDRNNEKINIENALTIAKNDIGLTTELSNRLKIQFDKEKNNLEKLKESLITQQQGNEEKIREITQKQEVMEPLLDKDEDGYYSKNAHIYEQYKDDITRYTNENNKIKQSLTNFDNMQESQNLKFIEAQYGEVQKALTELQAASKQEEAKEKQRLAEEKAKAEAKEAQRIAEEKAKAEADAKAKAEAKEAQRIAEEKAKAEADAKAKAEAKEAQRIAEEKAKAEADAKAKADAKEAQRIAEEKAKAEADAKAKAEAKEAQRIAEEKAKAEADAKAKADAKEAQRIAEEKAKAEADAKAKELIPVDDELELRAKEKEKNKPSVTISKPIDIENTYRSMQLAAENGYKLINQQQGQLRYLASATCNVGSEKACISGFTHYQHLNKANATQTGLSGAYRFDINHIPLVVGLAIDTDVYSSLPKGYKHQGYPLPLIGFSLDLIPSLNKELNTNALHLSLKGAYLNRKVSIERERLENTEAGKGKAKLSGYYVELQGYYPYSATKHLTLTPFAGITFNEVSRSAYSETQGAEFIAHYDKLKQQALSAKLGIGMDYLLNPSLTLNTKAGMFWQLSQKQRDFRSQIDYLGQQNIEYAGDKKQLKQRPFANMGLTYQLDKQSSLSTSANWEMTTYRYHDIQLGINYTYRF